MNDAMTPFKALMLKAATNDVFRKALKLNPRAALEAELFGPLPDNVTINVVENSPHEITLVLPPRASEELSDKDLDSVNGGFLSWASLLTGYPHQDPRQAPTKTRGEHSF